MIAILKYNAGNTFSVQNAVTRLGFECIVTDDKAELLKADKVIFPGVGQASSAMEYLRATGLDQTIISLRQPVLGICLGLQLMCKSSEEGDTACLGIFDLTVKEFPPLAKVPHTGWNNIAFGDSPLFKGVGANDDVYFVHSYYAPVSDNAIATCDYILPFTAALQKDNYYAVQFHTEKSGSTGERILKNFLSL